MFNLITYCNPKEKEPVSVILDGNVGSTPPILTWGSALLPFNEGPNAWKDPYPEVDVMLRRLVAACMAHLPWERPSHQELLDQCTQACGEPGGDDDDDDAVRDFVQRHILNAPEKSAHLRAGITPEMYALDINKR